MWQWRRKTIRMYVLCQLNENHFPAEQINQLNLKIHDLIIKKNTTKGIKWCLPKFGKIKIDIFQLN